MAKANRIQAIRSKQEATKSGRTFRTANDLPQNVRQQVIGILNARLADASDLKMSTKFAHWNVKGKDFFQLHELFDLIAGHLDEHIDEIAERATALGGVARGTLRQAAAGSSIPEYELNAVEGREHVQALSQRLARFGKLVRENIESTDDLEDKDTADLFTEISRQIDKDLWFLEAHIQA